MTVDVSLCGAIPRSEMDQNLLESKRLYHNDRRHSGARVCKDIHVDTAQANNKKCSISSGANQPQVINNKNKTKSSINDCLNTVRSQDRDLTMIEPPGWASSAKGDSWLEPLNTEEDNLYMPVDLTTKPFFRVGRTPSSDYLLHHESSSRRHALLFHHPNGSCYVVDCGSSHGTFVNGVRIQSKTMKTSCASNNNAEFPKMKPLVFPHRVKRGALLRFGGPGAPSFILKSFQMGLNKLKEACAKVDEFPSTSPPLENNCSSSLSLPLHITDERKDADSSEQALLALNTRINAIGYDRAYYGTSSTRSPLFSLKKRSTKTHSDEQNLLPPSKKIKFISLSDSRRQSSLKIREDAAVVSPTRSKPEVSTEDFDSIERPIVSPNPLDLTEDIKENAFMILNTTPKISKKVIQTKIGILYHPPSKIKVGKRVSFTDCNPQLLYPPSVTPDNLSDEDINESASS
eukprot:CAMPEP_0184859150 /NCGR_PEP_ID=MMETSP0580-20130426/4167_1 /TAXON_ID=1118495 /ORGANISM="Dactyliosolen fragilissimus" /LENGTH=458 /DNA_ID=CAMNT_0027355623 /DNA_START=610 /DNA_END=1986 /DNA_ORIENTATION=-